MLAVRYTSCVILKLFYTLISLLPAADIEYCYLFVSPYPEVCEDLITPIGYAWWSPILMVTKKLTHTDYDTEFYGESASQDHCDSSHSYFSIYVPLKAVSFPSFAPASFAICFPMCTAA